MMDARPRAGRWLLALAAMMILGTLAGCSNGVKAVDADLARRTLVAVLQSWKEGAAIGSLKDRSPSVVAQDMDWETGATLVDFRVIDEGKDGSVSLRIPVELTIRDKAGKESKKKVKYMVGTSPTITVFREIF